MAGIKRDLFVTDYFVKSVERALDEVYHFPLFPSATDTLNRQLKSGIRDDKLAELVLALRDDGRLCMVQDGNEKDHEPRVICSLGLRADA